MTPVVVGAVAWSYHSVRAALLDGAAVRLAAAAGELAHALTRNAGHRIAEAERLAHHPAVVASACEPGAANEAAARTAVEQAWPDVHLPLVVELWSAGGSRLLQVTRAPDPADGAATPAAAPFPFPGQAGLQPIRARDGIAFYEVVAAVATAPGSSPGTTVGWLVVRRAIRWTGAMPDLLGRLIGADVAVMLGNRAGGAWTDFERPVAGPALDPLGGERTYRTAGGTLRVGAGVPIAETPWLLWIDDDARAVLAPARRELWGMALVGLLLLLLGTGGAWAACRGTTSSLRAATAAAESIASGQAERRLEPRGPDEVRRLAAAFNTMAERVEDGRQRLEERVAARTAELADALAKLRATKDELARHEKLALLGQLAGGVGHELRNPLAVMSNAVYCLEMVLADAPPQVRECLGILRNQIALSDRIIGDLLDSVRIKEPRAEALRIEELVERQLDRLGRVPVEVVRDFPAGLPPAWADPVQVGQVVLNLVTNAIEALEAEGRPGTVTLRGRSEHGRVRLEVIDTGPGVAEELRERIFDPLFTTRPSGIGLGLAVSRQLAETNGGELRCEACSDGGGARFALILPAAGAEA